MGYEAAILKAWESLEAGALERFSLQFIGDTYTLDLAQRQVYSLSCNVPAKDFYAILILHYAAAAQKGLAPVRNNWVDFREVSQVEGYTEAFRSRCIAPVIRKYGSDPQALLARVAGRPYLKPYPMADAALVVEAFAGVPVLVTLWKGDEEFGPDANMLFDASIKEIFCPEDVAVLGQIVAASL
jgi:hypothetical protein